MAIAGGRPVVAVVGRPNVGKSTLFNKLIGQRLAIVKDTPGVTRDRLFAPCEWGGRTFMLADTGGIEPRADDVILSHMRHQAQLAIEQAEVIVLVTDVTAGVTAPVVNTGLFALGILVFFSDFLSGSAAAEGTSAIALLFLGWIGINFIVELVVNMLLATVINRVIALARRETARL